MNMVTVAYLCSRWELESDVCMVMDLTRGVKLEQHLDIMLIQGVTGPPGRVNLRRSHKVLSEIHRCDNHRFSRFTLGCSG